MEDNNKKPDNDFGAMFSAIFSSLYKNVSAQGSNGNSAEINDNTTFGEMSDKMGDVLKTAMEASGAEAIAKPFDEACGDAFGNVMADAVEKTVSDMSGEPGSPGPDNDKSVTDDTIPTSVPLESATEPTPGNPSGDDKPKPKKDLSEIFEEIFGSNLEHGIGECLKKIAPQVTDYVHDLSTKLKAREFFIEQLNTCTLSEAAEKTKQEFNLPDNVEFDVNVTIKF